MQIGSVSINASCIQLYLISINVMAMLGRNNLQVITGNMDCGRNSWKYLSMLAKMERLGAHSSFKLASLGPVELKSGQRAHADPWPLVEMPSSGSWAWAFHCQGAVGVGGLVWWFMFYFRSWLNVSFTWRRDGTTICFWKETSSQTC